MSILRRQKRDAAKSLNKSLILPDAANLIGNGNGNGEKKEREFPFTLHTPFGPTSLRVPLSGMKQCPCGSQFFETVNRIAYIKPRDQAGADWIALKAETYLCIECGREVQVNDQTIGDVSRGIVSENIEPNADAPAPPAGGGEQSL